MSDIVERAREEAALCRAETADDVATLLDELADEITRLRALLAECRVELDHAAVFVRTRERMASVGVELYDALLARIDATLKERGE